MHSLSMRERREWEERGGKADRLVASCSKVDYYTGVNGMQCCDYIEVCTF